MAKKLDTSHAIATAYRNFEFRSRLEAKWAVFFDLCGWKWSYEPIDCNGWIPDFALGHRPILVEIKPFFNSEEWNDQIAKMVASGHVGDVLMLGADPTWNACDYLDGQPPEIGWLLTTPAQCRVDGCSICPPWLIQSVYFGFMDGASQALGLCTNDDSWTNLIWKVDGRNARVSLPASQWESVLVHRWAEACNVSQWVPVNENRKRTANAS